MNIKVNKLPVNLFTIFFCWAPLLLSCTKTSSQMAPMQVAVQPIADTLRNDSSLKHYLALGDSYTIGQSVPQKERYPIQTVEVLRAAGYNMADAEIIATSGWTTADLLNAVKDKNPIPSFDVVTLLIGVNNQYQGGSISKYRTEFTTLLEKSIRYAGDKAERVVVLSIPDYSVTPFAAASDKEKITREIDSFNLINKKVSEAYHVRYLNVTEESRKALHDPSLIAYDGLHFSGKEYAVWTASLIPVMKEILK